jgi:zona occludens toxin|tara:strand:- start:1719 stop:2828 length:1110 start_codon:yes stop_codon:yes gene_type:complete
MTISAYVGLPGHGKSYTVTEHVILPALKSGRTVFTNIPMNDEECLAATGNQVTSFQTDDIIQNPNWWTEVFEAGAVIVIDEVWRLWPSGTRMNKAREQDKTFINEHRHMVSNGLSTEIILVSQDLIDIATFVRNKVDTTFRVVKLTKIGSKNKYRLDIYEGVVTGQAPPVKQRSRQIFGQFKSDVYKLYTSQTRGDGSFGDESRTDDRYNVLKGAAFKIIPIAILILAALSYSGFMDVKEGYTSPKSPTVTPAQPPSFQPPGPGTLSKSKPITSTTTKSQTLFDEIDKIFIASNNPILGLQLLVHSGQSQAFISGQVLKDNGITIKVLSDCFVLFFSGDRKLGNAMCQPDRSTTFTQSIVDRANEEMNI